MRIIDGLKLKGKPARIPDADRLDLPQFFLDMKFKKGVEIGVQRAYFTGYFGKAGLDIYGVDPWLAYEDYCPMEKEKYQKKQDGIYENAKRRMSKYPNVHLIRKTSMDAVKDFEDESLDFVYIDGHHGFKYVTEDIFEWSKKIKKGGVISGHDYAYNRTPADHAYCLQVKYVIDAYTKAFQIDNWYVLGRDKRESKEEKRETYRSWLWIKR